MRGAGTLSFYIYALTGKSTPWYDEVVDWNAETYLTESELQSTGLENIPFNEFEYDETLYGGRQRYLCMGYDYTYDIDHDYPYIVGFSDDESGDGLVAITLKSSVTFTGGDGSSSKPWHLQ